MTPMTAPSWVILDQTDITVIIETEAGDRYEARFAERNAAETIARQLNESEAGDRVYRAEPCSKTATPIEGQIVKAI